MLFSFRALHSQSRISPGVNGYFQPQEDTRMFGGKARREQKQEDRQEFGRRGTATRYKMKERMFSIGDDFWIEDEQGHRVYKINGKVLALADSLDFEDPHGKVLVKMRGKVITIRGQIKLDRPGGSDAVVKKDLINIIRDHLTLSVAGEGDYDIRGNLLDHEYEILRGRDKVAEVSKKWFRLRDTYGVQIEPGADDVLFLAATVAVDQLCHDIK
jgi:uncharacterized protein YxjI